MNDLAYLSIQSEYNGGDRIAVGNGIGLEIQRFGSSILSSASKSF